MKKIFIAFLSVILFVGCHSITDSEGIPSNAVCIAESPFHQLYIDRCCVDSLKVSLYSYDKGSGESRLLLTTNPQARGDGLVHEESCPIPVSNIRTVQKATILSWKDEPLTILIEYCTDYRNVESIIFQEGKTEAIHLPSNRGLLGVSEEDSFLIMQSYEYYEQGGRYNTIEAFDVDGHRVAFVSLGASPGGSGFLGAPLSLLCSVYYAPSPPNPSPLIITLAT